MLTLPLGIYVSYTVLSADVIAGLDNHIVKPADSHHSTPILSGTIEVEPSSLSTSPPPLSSPPPLHPSSPPTLLPLNFSSSRPPPLLPSSSSPPPLLLSSSSPPPLLSSYPPTLLPSSPPLLPSSPPTLIPLSPHPLILSAIPACSGQSKLHK